MADNSPTGPLEMGANMDYAEHERTYGMFTTLAKYCTLICAALMVAMAFGFFVSSAGFFSSLILFVLICAVGGYLLR